MHEYGQQQLFPRVSPVCLVYNCSTTLCVVCLFQPSDVQPKTRPNIGNGRQRVALIFVVRFGVVVANVSPGLAPP